MEIKPEKVINADETITGLHQGSVRVLGGAELTLNGTLQGSLCIENGKVINEGWHQGSVSILSGSTLRNNRSLQGSVYVEQGGYLENSQGAKLAGSLNVSGTLVNYGVRGGSVTGRENVIDKPGSQVKHPVVTNGMNIYNW